MQVKAVPPAKSEIAADPPARQQDVAVAEQTEQHSGTVASLLRLQRAQGNRYVQRAIRAKLEVSHPGDPYERKADQVAERVMNMSDAMAANSMQRAMLPEEDKEQKIQTKSLVASITPIVQRQLGKDEEEDKPIQTKSAGSMADSFKAVADVETQVSLSKGRGSPLPGFVRAYMEPRFGADFSAVCVHTGSDARQMNPFTEEGEGGPVDRTIQRNGGGTPREFIPRITRDPDITFMKIYDHHRQSFRINNRREAPAGTSFRWGFGVDPNGVIDLLSDRTTDGGATKQVEVEGQKPGDSRIQATPVYQVPGGPEMTGETQYADISVEEPTLELFSISYRRADGTGIASDRIGVGDKIIARVKVGNVDGAHMTDPNIYSLAGEGHTLVSTGPLTPVQQFGDGRSYDAELTARTPGSVNAELELGIGRMVLGRGPKVIGINAEIEYNRQEFINLANQCDTKISIAYTRANSIMEVLSAAYGNAYDTHVKVLEAQDASNRLLGELILNAALAFMPGGVGGVVGGMMKNAKFGDFMVDAVKDMAKAGTRGVQAALLPGRGGGGPMQPMADDPRTWRAQYAVRVNTEKEHVLGILDEWKTKANSSDPDFYMNFNPVTVTEQSLTVKGTPMNQVTVPDQAEQEKKFELGFWRDWLQKFAYTVETTVSGCPAIPHSYAKENQGKKIRDRINALGENGDQWLERFGGVARRRAEAEAERRNRDRFRY